MRTLPFLVFIACSPLPEGALTLGTLDGQTLLAAGEGKLYGGDAGGVWRMNTAPSGPRTVIVPKDPVYDLLLDEQRILFTQGAENTAVTARRANFEGGSVTDLAANVQRGSLRQDASYVYFFDRSEATAALARVGKQGGATQKLADAGLTLSPEIAVDESNVYWLDSTAPAALKKVAKSGGTPVVFLADISPTLLTIDGDDVYFLDSRDGVSTVFAVNKASGEKREVVKDCNRFWLDGTYVYYTSYTRAKNTTQSFKRFARGTSKTDILLLSLGTLSLLQVAFDKEHVYWADGEEVRSLPKPTAQ